MTTDPEGPIVVVCDHPARGLDVERRLFATIGARLRVPKTRDPRELHELTADADAIMTCFATVPDSVVAAARRLKVIGRFGVGVDNIAVDAATRRKIPVTNVPVYCTDEVAEHVLGLLLALARRICTFDRAVRSGDWELATGAPIFRVAGKTLGLVGFGVIGRAVCERARAVGLRVLVADPWAVPADIAAAGAEPAELDALLADADFVSLHTPLTPETRGLLDWPRLCAMKPTAYVVNASRGAVVDLDALERALRVGRIAGAALDVFEPERLPPDHPLLAQGRLVATPHVAFYSEESIADLSTRAVENVIAVLDGRRPGAVVNPEVLMS